MLSLHLAEGKTLPVFGSEQEAELFAKAWNERLLQEGLPPEEVREWRGRGTGAGELISLLSGSAFSAGPCNGVERIVLDPPVESIPSIRQGHARDRRDNPLPSVSRACFMERLMGRGRAWFDGTQSK